MKKIAVVGSGKWGRNHVKTLHQMGALGAIVEVDEGLQREAAKQYPGTSVFPNIDSALEEEILSGFVIATPAQTHANLTNLVLDARKAVLVEKPMTLTSTDAVQLVEKAETLGQVLMVGHLLLFQPAIQFIKQYIDSGKLGTIFTIHQVRAKLGRARQHENVLWSLGVHDVAVLLHLVGQSPKETKAMGHCGLQPAIADDVYVQMEFPNGIQAHLHNSWLWPLNERRLIVTGSEGMLVYDEFQQNVVHHRKTIDPTNLQNIDNGEEIVFEGHAQPLELELSHFIDRINGTSDAPVACGRSALPVIQVLESALR